MPREIIKNTENSENLNIYGFDRYELWIDRPELPITQNIIRKHCANIKVNLGQMVFNANWKLQVGIFQPKNICHAYLGAALGSDVRVLINYVEFSCDIPANSAKRAKWLHRNFIGSAKMLNQRQKVFQHKGTDYYGRRANENDSKRSNVLAVYSDRPSKINNREIEKNALNCLHIEYRVTGSAALARQGVVSLEDLTLFDHESFWSKNIRIYQLPSLTELGQLIGKINSINNDISSTALRKRANKWKDKFRNDDGDFVMHNALLETPKLIRYLKIIPFTEWLNAMLNLESNEDYESTNKNHN